MSQWSHPFRDVLDEELNRFGEPRAQSSTDAGVRRRAQDARLAGLAFSGGGIRSATFALGVLQALADLRLLKKFDYLSTVSGGGYIGSWLVAWIHRRGGRLDEVSSALRTSWSKQVGQRGPDEIFFLRRFSNYLTPKLGWLGADTWTLIAIYLRNVLLNMITLLGALACVIMLPRLVGLLMGRALPPATGPFAASAWLFYALLAVAGFFVVLNLAFLKRRELNLWSGGALRPNENEVRELIGETPVSLMAGADLLFPGERPHLFGDFVLELDFLCKKPPSLSAEASARFSVYLRAGANEPGWEISLHDPDKEKPNERTSATNLQPRPERFPRLHHLRLVCVGQTCTVSLDGCIVEVVRSVRGKMAPGRVALGHVDGTPSVTITNLLVRRLTDLPRLARQGWVQSFIVLPLLLAGVISVHRLGQIAGADALPTFWSHESQWVWWAAVSAFVLIVGTFVEGAREAWLWLTHPKPPNAMPLTARRMGIAIWRGAWNLFSILIGGAIGGLALGRFHQAMPAIPENFWPRLVWGPPAFVVAVSIMLVLYVGLRGTHLSEPMREWWSRLGAWLLIYALLWTGLFVIAFYSPPFLQWLDLHLKSGLAALSLGWVGTTIGGLLASTSAKTGRRSKNSWLEIVVAIAPYIFIVGLLAGISWGINGLVSPVPISPPTPLAAGAPLGVNVQIASNEPRPVEVKVSPNSHRGPALHTITAEHWRAMSAAHLPPRNAPPDFSRQNPSGLPGNLLFFILLGSSALTAGLLAWCVDINEFSMHMMYRNRLARCYLGASNAGLRRPHPFTGFDQNDDIQLADLAARDWQDENSGPYPIVNCSINLVGGHELAWQQRKAASFTFTPLSCGYDFSDLPPGYCPTAPNDETKVPAYAASHSPLWLATAMAISGAAVSPNMGYHTSPAPAFLMTLFNVRLGWWIGNPRNERGWRRSGPWWALASLIAEMFGLTHAEGKYIYLSDGGHFENLGIYELVRRRCRFIIACDAEEDGNFEFEGLGNAIEKCRADLGVDIELDVEAIRQRDEKGHSQWHCAVGRIRYDKTDPEGHAGTILYLKSSLTGDEPTDVLRYAARAPAFPHESTLDQFFGESQFESYRMLGHHAAMETFCRVDAPEKLADQTTERLFVNLAQRWYPPSTPIDPSFQRRGETLTALYETLSTDPKLRFLSRQIYIEWGTLLAGLDDPPEPVAMPGPWIPPNHSELRAGFYFCNRLISLMEDIYHDLHLEHEHGHPDNRGWMNLFMHWAWSRMFRTTWTVSAANCGARFQNFCTRHLGLEVGRVDLIEQMINSVLTATAQPTSSQLSFVEWELVHSFFKDRDDLVAKSELLLIQIFPGDVGETKVGEKEPAFTVGFVILRAAQAEEKGRQLMYLRVRDHVRRMGMARRAIHKLLDKREEIGLDLWPMPNDAIQPDEAALHEVFLDLFRGVQTEFALRQKEEDRAAAR